MAEHVPIGDRVSGAVPLRHPIAPGAEHPVERAARDRQFGPVLGADDLLHQRVDRGIGDAGEVVGSLGRGRLRRKERPQASPGVADMLKRSIVMSKSKSSTPRAVLHGVDDRKLASIPSVPRFLI